MDKKRIEKLIKDIIIELGEDAEREGLVETPRRVSEMLEEFFKNEEKSEDLIKVFKEDFENQGLIEVKDIRFCSLCEHHMLPFRGVAHIKYLPSEGNLIGISKLARIVNYFSKGLQIQERITNKVADFLFSKFPIKGVEVTLEAEHLCMTIRGVKSPGAITKTSTIRGILVN